MNTKPTLDDLYSDSGAYDEAEVVTALQPYLTIQKSTNQIFFKDFNLKADKKITAYVLAKKLLKSKGLIDSELVTASEVHEKTGIKKGTVDPTFKKLKESGLFVGKKEYEIPAYKVAEAVSMLSKN